MLGVVEIRIILEKGPAGKRSLGIPRMRREDRVKKDKYALGGESKVKGTSIRHS